MLNTLHNGGKLVVAYAFAYTLAVVSPAAGIAAAIGVTAIAVSEILLAKQVQKVRDDYQKQIEDALGEAKVSYLNN